MAYANIVTVLGWRGVGARNVIKAAGIEQKIWQHEGLEPEDKSDDDESDDNSDESRHDKIRDLDEVKFRLGKHKLTVGWLDPGLSSAEHPEIYVYIGDLCYTAQSCGDDDFECTEIPLGLIFVSIAEAHSIEVEYPSLPPARMITIVVSDSK